MATNKDKRWIFVFSFAKNARSNIDNDEEKASKTLAAYLLSFTPRELDKAQNANE